MARGDRATFCSPVGVEGWTRVSGCSERRILDALAEAQGVGLMALNGDGEVEFASGELRELLSGDGKWGFDSRSVLQATISAAVEQLRRSGSGSVKLDFELATAAAPRRMQMEMRAGGSDGQPAYLALVRDGKEAAALADDLYCASCFKTLPTLYVGAAHDLRGPLNNIAVILELLKHSAGKSDAPGSIQRQQEYFQRVQGEVKRLNQHVQALLDLADPPTPDGEGEFDVARILQDVAHLVRGKARLQQVDIEECEPSQPALVRCRRGQLRQALLNVVINALEAMPDGGKLRLELSHHDGRLVIDVCDTGSGIPEAIEERVFTLHFGTKPAATGLGLYVARATIDSLGGTITVAREQPGETCLRITLPAAQSASSSALSYPDEPRENV